jgi:hypothetical protein
VEVFFFVEGKWRRKKRDQGEEKRGKWKKSKCGGGPEREG